MAGQILGEAVGDGDGATCQQEFQRHGATDDVGCAHDYCVHAVEVGAGAVQQCHDAFRCAGAEQGDALGQAADVVRVETVHVLVGVDAFQQQRSVEVFGQRQLDQDAVDGRVFIEAVDQGEQVGLAGTGRQVMSFRQKADFLAVLAFMRDVDLGGGIAADQDHREARDSKSLLAALGDALGYLLAEAGGDRFAVDQLCGHDARLTIGKAKKGAYSRMEGPAGKGGWSAFSRNSFIFLIFLKFPVDEVWGCR
ncbi:hypothetical protein D9M68_719710 [compost metagenome]